MTVNERADLVTKSNECLTKRVSNELLYVANGRGPKLYIWW
jgi:hypothetical protein